MVVFLIQLKILILDKIYFNVINICYLLIYLLKYLMFSGTV